MTRPLRGLLVATALLCCAVLTACGRKGDPRPVTQAAAVTVLPATVLMNPIPQTEITLS